MTSPRPTSRYLAGSRSGEGGGGRKRPFVLSQFKKRLPGGFHDLLLNLTRAIVVYKPHNIILFCAQLLESELERETLNELTTGWLVGFVTLGNIK
jgi:hypothetical protein